MLNTSALMSFLRRPISHTPAAACHPQPKLPRWWTDPSRPELPASSRIDAGTWTWEGKKAYAPVDGMERRRRPHPSRPELPRRRLHPSRPELPASSPAAEFVAGGVRHPHRELLKRSQPFVPSEGTQLKEAVRQSIWTVSMQALGSHVCCRCAAVPEAAERGEQKGGEREVLDVLVFTWPTLGLSMCSPLMSLMDDHGHARGSPQNNNFQNKNMRLAQAMEQACAGVQDQRNKQRQLTYIDRECSKLMHMKRTGLTEMRQSSEKHSRKQNQVRNREWVGVTKSIPRKYPTMKKIRSMFILEH